MLPLGLEESRREENITFGSSFYWGNVSGKLKLVVDKVKIKQKTTKLHTCTKKLHQESPSDTNKNVFNRRM